MDLQILGPDFNLLNLMTMMIKPKKSYFCGVINASANVPNTNSFKTYQDVLDVTAPSLSKLTSRNTSAADYLKAEQETSHKHRTTVLMRTSKHINHFHYIVAYSVIPRAV